MSLAQELRPERRVDQSCRLRAGMVRPAESARATTSEGETSDSGLRMSEIEHVRCCGSYSIDPSTETDMIIQNAAKRQDMAWEGDCT